MSSYLGGNLSQNEREKLGYMKKLLSCKPVNMGWRWQCYCGECTYVRYRGRFYCQWCARRVLQPDSIVINGKDESFRTIFTRLEKESQ